MNDFLEKALGCFHRTLPSRVVEYLGLSAHASSDSTCGRDGGNSQKDLPLPPPPDPITLEKLFSHFVSELDLTPEHQESLFELDSEKKWTILCENSHREERGRTSKSVEYFIEKLELFRNSEEKDSTLQEFQLILDALRVTLKSESHSYVEKFVEYGGVDLLSEWLRKCGRDYCNHQDLSSALLHCIKALLNSTHGRQAVLSNNAVLPAVAVCIGIEYPKTKILASEILAGTCVLPPEGHQKVLSALSSASSALGERRRFQKLLFDLYRPFPNAKEQLQVRTSILTLLNTLLSTGVAQKSVEFRLSLRWEFLNLGMQEVVEHLRSTQQPSILNDHLDLFEMMREEDEDILLGELGGEVTVEVTDTHSLTRALKRRFAHTDAYPHLLSLHQRLLLFPGDQKHVPLWRFVDLMVANLMLQANLGCTQGIENTHIDLRDVLQQLRKEDVENLQKVHQKAEEELEKRRKEVEILKNRIGILEEEIQNLKHSRPVTIDTGGTGTRNKKNSGLNFPPTPPDSPPTSLSPDPTPNATAHGNGPSLSRISETGLGSSEGGPVGGVRVFPKNIPPAPPPPPPGLLNGKKGVAIRPKTDTPKKSVPKPSVNLKTVNWPKLPSRQLDGTVWKELNDEELYKVLDLSDIEQKFGIGTLKTDIEEEEMMGTIGRRLTRESVVSVVEGRRAQNCTILLSKLKLSPLQIRTAILNMDTHGIIPKDMAEQLLKYVPTEEERIGLGEMVDSGVTLPTVDSFLWEMSQIPRYEQRLRCLHYRKVFRDYIEDLQPQIQAVTSASVVVGESEKLKELLAVILALGNYLNHGKRNSDAVGFQLSALNNLQDVKSSISTGSDYTLLHYLVETSEKHFPHLLGLKRDLSSVFEASRIGKQDLEMELKQLKEGLELIAEEIEIHGNLSRNRSRDSSDAGSWEGSGGEEGEEEDQFLPIMTSFYDVASQLFTELRDTAQHMNTQFGNTVRRFGFDPKTSSPDEFFGILARFLSSFSDVQRELRRKREEQERRKRTLNWGILGFGTKKHNKSPQSRPNPRGGGHGKGDFDQLISALQSGELFSEELTRLRCSFRSPKRKEKKEKRGKSPRAPPPTQMTINGISRDR